MNADQPKGIKEIVGFRPNDLNRRLLAKAIKANPHKPITAHCNEGLTAILLPQFGGKVERDMAKESTKAA